jgi:Holliday junction resolvasome RuvABC endonuclease subunit
MIILGIDPGMSTGWAIVADGRLVILGQRELGARHRHWATLAGILRGLITEYSPDAIAWEEPVARGIAGASLNRALGVIELVAQESGLPYASVNPMTLKKATAGTGSASKDQMRQAIVERVGFELPAGSDAIDAVAVALYAVDGFEWE